MPREPRLAFERHRPLSPDHTLYAVGTVSPVQGAVSPQASLRSSRAPRQKRDTPITVTDDWPQAVPVTDHEARIIEAFFADVLDDLFGDLPR
jgi:hypothetical protein